MKPHEDMLRRETNGQNPALVSASDGRMVAQLRCQDVAGWEALFIAASDMAKALLINGYVRTMEGRWHTDACNEMNDGGASCFASCEQARASLIKAGVLTENGWLP